MKTIPIKCLWAAAVLFSSFSLQFSTFAFEGRINASVTRGGQSDTLLYTVGTDFLRVEMTATNRPNTVDIVNRQTGAITLLYPHNRSFVHLKSFVDKSSVPGALPQMPSAPNMPQGMPAMPALPRMQPPMIGKIEMHDTGKKTNILGIDCEQYEIKQRGETMEIWATDQLFPFQVYVPRQPLRFAPPTMEEQWPELVKAKKLFAVRAVLRYEGGVERFRFEVQSVTPEKIAGDDAKLFQPPPDFFEIQPLPF